MKNLFLIIGAPGSGKTTDAQIISQNDKTVAHYSTGELLRSEIASGSKVGATIAKRINAGELVLVEVALDIIIKAINNSTCNTILIDGYPRSNEQMMALDCALKHEKGICLKSVIEVIVSQKTAKKRVIGRNRGEDDSVEVFKNRMVVYNKPLPLIEKFYENKNLLQKISGEEKVEIVVKKMKNIIDNLI